MLVKHCTLGVHQVEIKIVHTAGFQLALEKGTDVSLSFEESAGQLVGRDVAVAGGWRLVRQAFSAVSLRP